MTETFKIFADEEATTNNKITQNAQKLKEGRTVLGVLQDCRRARVSHKNGVIYNGTNTVSSGFIDNIRALDIKDRLTSQASAIKEESNVKEESLVKEESHVKEENECATPNTVNIIEEPKPGDIGKENTTVAVQNNEIISKKEVKVPNEEEIESNTKRTDTFSKTLLDTVNSEYQKDIYSHLQQLERLYQPTAYYMRRQPEITNVMRRILVDWLVEVGEEFHLSNHTLFLSVSMVDRFLSIMAITKAKFQLLGTSAMLIASKYEEVDPPTVDGFTFLTDYSYTRDQVLRMERLILKVLKFEISNPTVYTFLENIMATQQCYSKILHLAMYLAELTLLDAEPYLQYYPSMVASAVIAFARHCLDYKIIWPSNLANTTGYTLTRLAPLINHISETHKNSFKIAHPGIRSKYNCSKYHHASLIPYRKLCLRVSC